MRAYFTITATRPIVALLCSSLIIGVVGCMPPHQIPLAHDVLAMPQQRFSDHIVMQKQADDRRENPGRIGHLNATLFAIEAGSVETTSPLPIEIVMQVKEALESTGYQITLADAPHAAPLPSTILKIQIDEFYFKNYSWFWPLFFTWGNIALTLTLENHEGKALFAKTFQQSRNFTNFSFFPQPLFDVAIKETLTEILNQIVNVSSTEEFRQALKT